MVRPNQRMGQDDDLNKEQRLRLDRHPQLKGRLTRLVEGWPNRRLAELTPWTWKAAQTDVVRAA